MRTVLEYVQSTLNIMDSDLVDSISDTEEAMQVAELLRDVYLELVEREDWAFLFGPATLTAAGDVTQPTKFTIPETVRFIETVRYDVAAAGAEYQGREICWLEPEDFLSRFSTQADQTTTTLVTLSNQIKFYVRNDTMPSFYTSFDDLTIHMDAHNSSQQSTLTSTRLTVWACSVPAVTVTDGSVLLIPRHMEPLLQSELNRQASIYYKDKESTPDERKARRQLAQARRRDSRITRKQDEYYTNRYGRESRSVNIRHGR